MIKRVLRLIRAYTIPLSYMAILLLGYLCLSNKGFGQLILFTMLSISTIWYVKQNIRTSEEDWIHLSLILYYVNGACIIAFFFWLCMRMDIKWENEIVLWRMVGVWGFTVLMYMLIKLENEDYMLPSSNDKVQKYTRRIITIMVKNTWYVQIKENASLRNGYRNWYYVLTFLCIVYVPVYLYHGATWWLLDKLVLYNVILFIITSIAIIIQILYIMYKLDNRTKKYRRKDERAKKQ